MLRLVTELRSNRRKYIYILLFNKYIALPPCPFFFLDVGDLVREPASPISSYKCKMAGSINNQIKQRK